MATQQLSNLEQEIMDAVWKLEACSVRDIMKAREGKKNLAYTTIATIVDRLYAKGVVKRQQSGKQFIYLPAVSKREFGSTVATTFIQRFMQNFGDVAVASFAESIDKLPEKKRASLIARIKKYEKK